jgi:hypothetical protein
VRSNREDPADASPPCRVDHRHLTGCNVRRELEPLDRRPHPRDDRSPTKRCGPRSCMIMTACHLRRSSSSVGSRCRCRRKKAWILDIRTAAPRANVSPIEHRAAPRQSDIDAQTLACAVVPRSTSAGGACRRGYPQHPRLLPQFVRPRKNPANPAATPTGQRKVSSTYRNDCRAGTGTRRNRNRVPETVNQLPEPDGQAGAGTAQ